MDSVLDCLDELGSVVPRTSHTPNAKVPMDLLPQLDARFGYQPDNAEVTNPKITIPKEVKDDFSQLRSSTHTLMRLASEQRVGRLSEPYIDENKRLLKHLTELSLSNPKLSPAIRQCVEGLSEDLSRQIRTYRSKDKHKKGSMMKADFIVRIRNRYLVALDEMVVDEVVETIEVGWDRVFFGNGRLLLDIGKEKRLSIMQPQSREAYNLFRTAFILRVPPIVVRMHSKRSPEVVETPEYREVFQYLEIRNAIHLGAFSRRIDLVKFLQTSKLSFQETFLPKDRGPYIQFLVEKQASPYRFVPVYESSVDKEDAFLFTLRGSSLYIVWENINENTATYVFQVNSDTYNQALQAVFDYASSDTDYKRMRMHYGQSRKAIGFPCKIIYHKDYAQWSKEILSLLK